MITKIDTIKNFNIFDDFQWKLGENFKKKNIIFGYNGSGKTTLSRLFNLFATPSKENRKLKYKFSFFEENSEKKFKENQEFKEKKILVFNKDYIDRNIFFSTGKTKNTKPLYIGEKNIKIKKEILEKVKKIQSAKDEKEKLEKEKKIQTQNKEKYLSYNAKIIKEKLKEPYTKTNLRKDIERFVLSRSKQKISNEEEIKECEKRLEEKSWEECSEYFNFPDYDETNKLFLEIEKICEKKINIKNIYFLEKTSELYSWIKKGLIFFNSDSKNDNCKFCEQKMPIQRLKILKDIFNEEEKKFSNEIKDKKEALKKIKEKVDSFSFPDTRYFPKYSWKELEEIKKELEEKNKSFKEKINFLLKKLELKSRSLTKKVNLELTFENFFPTRCLSKLKELIKKYNKKLKNKNKEDEETKEKIKKHCIFKIHPEYKKTENNILSLEKKIKLEEESICKSEKEIEPLRKKNDQSLERINDNLKSFFTYREIIFEKNDNEEGGFLIKRKNQDSYEGKISEGEKTIIAISYFLTELSASESSKSIVVIDDPISSLDSNYRYQVFAAIKKSLEEFHQIFILTHNFDFLKDVLSWFKREKNNSSFFMIKNEKIKNKEKRKACIEALDSTLKNFETEFQFLFKILFDFVNEGGKKDPTIAESYNIPNITRKFLETFFMHVQPDNKNLSHKMEAFCEKNKENNPDLSGQKDAIYKFVNNNSHKSGKGMEESLPSNSLKNVKQVFEWVKIHNSDYFETLEDEACNEVN